MYRHYHEPVKVMNQKITFTLNLAVSVYRLKELYKKPMAALKQVKVSVVNSGQPYRTEIKAGSHTFYADEPEAAGGKDTAPAPHQLFLSALGACTAITVKMYAARKNWPLESISIDLTLDREVLNGSQQSVFIQEISLVGPLDEEQVKRLLEIAGKCPVHKTLHSEIRVETLYKASI